MSIERETSREIVIFPDDGEKNWYVIKMPVTDRFSDALKSNDKTAWGSLIGVCQKIIERTDAAF